jgi:prohibitin 2
MAPQDDVGKKIFGYMLLGVAGVLLLIAVFGSVYTIQSGEQGILLTWGRAEPGSVQAGLHFKWPIAQSVVKFDVRTQKYETGASAASSDLQVVSTNIAVNYHLEPSAVPVIFGEIGATYEAKLIQPMVQDSVKAATATFTAEKLITERPLVRERVLTSLQERLRPRGIIVEDISMTNFDFSPEFNKAIELKVTAEQQKLKASNDLERIKIEAEQIAASGRGERDAAIARAEGEAAKVKLVREELERSPAYIEYVKAQKWDGRLPWFTGGSTPFVDVRSMQAMSLGLNQT